MTTSIDYFNAFPIAKVCAERQILGTSCGPLQLDLVA